MTTQEQYVAKIKQLVIQKYGRNISSADDCASLSDAIEKSVGVRIDMPTLQLLFSRNKSVMMPRLMVLSTLAKYVGYEDWSDFCAAHTVSSSDDSAKIPVRRRWGVIVATVIGIAVILLGALFVLNGDEEVKSEDKTTAAYNLVVSDVTAKYVMMADIECLALRAHDGTNRIAFEEQTQETISRYRSEVSVAIADDIRAAAAEANIEVDDASVDASAAKITDRCVAILEEILK